MDLWLVLKDNTQERTEKERSYMKPVGFELVREIGRRAGPELVCDA